MDTTAAIRAAIQRFVIDMERLARESAIQAVIEALDGNAAHTEPDVRPDPIAKRLHAAGLRDAEKAVLELKLSGLSMAMIAAARNVTRATIKTQLRELRRKLARAGLTIARTTTFTLVATKPRRERRRAHSARSRTTFAAVEPHTPDLQRPPTWKPTERPPAFSAVVEVETHGTPIDSAPADVQDERDPAA